MKCVKKANGKESPIRVDNQKVESLVKNGSHIYVSKTEWKEGGRNR